MTKPIEFYFDFVSPYSYLAHKQIRIIEKKENIKINYKPIFLGGLHKLVGITAPAFINPNGKVLKSLNTRESGNIELNFPYFNQTTLFSEYGNKIFFSMILLYIFLALIFKKLKI